MSVQEVTQLRKSGNLIEAYEMALSEIKENNNEWTQMSMFWVLRDLCNEHIKAGNKEKAKICYNLMGKLVPTMKDDNDIGKSVYDRIHKLILPEGDNIEKSAQLSKEKPAEAFDQIKQYLSQESTIDDSLHEDIGWVLYRYLKNNATNLTSLEVKKIMCSYNALRNQRPSLLHSLILAFAVYYSKDHPDFRIYDYFLLWNPKKFRREDLIEETFNGKKMPSLASRVCRRCMEMDANVDVEQLIRDIPLATNILLDLFREPIFWKIMNLQKEGKTKEMFDAFSSYSSKYASYGPSHWNSEILKLAERFMTEQETWRFILFFKAFGYENFMKEDWKDETDGRGNTYRPLASKCAKRCFEHLKGHSDKDGEFMQWLSVFYDELIKRTEKDEWILRQRAILYLWQQQYDSAIHMYKSLLSGLSDKYYVWSELSDCIQNDNDLRISLLSKALLLEKDENYLGSIHLTLAALLIKKEMKAEALCELNIYNKNHDKVADRYTSLLGLVKDTATTLKNNRALYYRYAGKADEFIFADIVPTNLTIAEKWEKDGKERCLLTDGKNISFQTLTKRFPVLSKAPIGTALKIRYQEKTATSQDGKSFTQIIPLTVQYTDDELWSGLPLKYGYVEYLNEEKKILHIVTQDSKMAFTSFSNNWGSITKGDFVSFRIYEAKRNGKSQSNVINVIKIDDDVAISSFPTAIVAVNAINETKNLFHYTSGCLKKLNGIVRFSETNIRPCVGQCLKVVYFIKKEKEGDIHMVTIKVEETEETNPNTIKEIRGYLELKYEDYDESSPSFAFVNNVYVHRKILEKYDITTNQDVIAHAVYIEKDRWNVYKIEKPTTN